MLAYYWLGSTQILKKKKQKSVEEFQKEQLTAAERMHEYNQEQKQFLKITKGTGGGLPPRPPAPPTPGTIISEIDSNSKCYLLTMKCSNTVAFPTESLKPSSIASSIDPHLAKRPPVQGL